MNIQEAIRLLKEERGFNVSLITYKYRVSDEDGVFTFNNDEELIKYAIEQKEQIY